MTPEQQIENFASGGWVAQHVRYEPVARLRGRLKISASLAVILNAIFFTSLFVCIGFWVTDGSLEMSYMVIALLLFMLFGSVALVAAIAALQMWRFINFRMALAAKGGVAS